MDSPRLPWEVVERVIDFSNGRPNTLCSLTLTCRQLRHRSRLTMFGRVQLESNDHVFAFVAFLQANPNLKTLVHTIIVTPAAFGPSLLYILPNLSSIECVDESQLEEPEDEDEEDDDEGDWDEGEDEEDEMPSILDRMHGPTSVRVNRSLSAHHSSLACFRRLGAHIRSLRLNSVSFPTSLAFARVLLAFASISHLVCREVEVKTAGNEAPLEVIIRRLSVQMRLKALTIDSLSLSGGSDGGAACPGTLLFDPCLAPSIVESLVVEVSRADVLLDPSSWWQLQRLELRILGEVSVDGAAGFLESCPTGPGLREVLIEWRILSIKQIIPDLARTVNEPYPGYQAYKRLEHALLRFPQPRVTFLVLGPVDANTLSFWRREVGKHLPVLLGRGGVVTVECEEGESGNIVRVTAKLIIPPILVSFAPQHHDGVQALVISPDSKWVATASLDCTVIIWDTINCAIVQQWVAHGYRPVKSLAFSPNSRYLISGGDDGKAVIWDLVQGGCKVNTLLGGHVQAVLTCVAWSPDGDTIATGSEDGSAQLWDAHTFRQRAHVQLKGVVTCLTFSPDGAWLVCGSRLSECFILNVGSGTLHRSLWNSPSNDYTSYRRTPDRALDTIAAFDPTCGSMRLATAPCGSCAGINVVNVETGIVLVHLGGKLGELMRMRDVSFSPDGRLVLGVLFAPLRGKAAFIWEASTGVALFNLGRHTDAIRKARFSPCGRYIASAGMDRTVRLWRTSDGSCLATLCEHRDAVEHVAFSPDGQTLSSGASDGTVVIRQMRDIISME